LPKSRIAGTKGRKPKSTKFSIRSPNGRRLPIWRRRNFARLAIRSSIVSRFSGRSARRGYGTPLLPDAMRARLGKREMPEKGADIALVLEKFSRLFFEHSTHNGSPRFFATSLVGGAHQRAGRPSRRFRQSKLRCVGALTNRNRNRERIHPLARAVHGTGRASGMACWLAAGTWRTSSASSSRGERRRVGHSREGRR